jgi:dTDP-4-amino-4,6-dideoxygalactose transaminase
MRQVKFVDLAAQNLEIRDDVEREFELIHEQTAYVGGAAVKRFEEEFAAFLGVRHVIGVSSGTDALRLSLLALGVGPDDEVITTPFTFIATVAAIVQTGARPVFVDIDPATCNLSVAATQRYLESGLFRPAQRAKVILPVHLYGLPAAMGPLCELAARYGLKIVEDACQAHGANLAMDGRRVRAGSTGAVGCFSFYPGKNLGAWGEAGAIATNLDEVAEAVALFRDHGRISHYAHQGYGYNARLDTLQPAVLSAKLKRLEDWNQRRREAAALYRELLADSGVQLPAQPDGYDPCYHLFVIRSERRDAIRSALLANQIDCGIHYPVPLHLQPACNALGYRRGDFPESERVADNVLSLPMHPHLTRSELIWVASVVRDAVKSDRGMFAGERYEHKAACIPPPRG